MRRAFAGALVSMWLLVAGQASAQEEVPQRRMGISWDEGAPRVTFSVRDLVNADAREKLASGLPQTIVMRVYAYQAGEPDPVAITLRSCRVVYDLWEEVYRVQVQTARTDRTVTVADVDDVLEQRREVDALPAPSPVVRGRADA